MAACVAALVGVFPAIIFHGAFMSEYPAIVEQRLPAYWLIERTMPPLFLGVYVAIVYVLVAQTGVALLQGVLETLDEVSAGRTGRKLSRTQHAVAAGAAVVISTGFASVGLVQLIVAAFSFLSAGFLVVFFVPLFLRGGYLIWTARGIRSDR